MVDTHVVLDVLLARQPFVRASAEVFGLVEQAQLKGVLCATSPANIEH